MTLKCTATSRRQIDQKSVSPKQVFDTISAVQKVPKKGRGVETRERRNVESLYVEILNTCSESHKIVECVTQFLNRHQLRVVVIGQTALCSVHHEVARHTIITVIVQISDVHCTHSKH